MRISKKTSLLALGVAAALAGTGAAIADATGDDEDASRSIQGAALPKASAATLAHTGGGRVSETEAGDEEGAYEVEVTRADGSQVDVHLDSNFRVIDAATDDDDEDDDD